MWMVADPKAAIARAMLAIADCRVTFVSGSREITPSASDWRVGPVTSTLTVGRDKPWTIEHTVHVRGVERIATVPLALYQRTLRESRSERLHRAQP